MATAAILPTVIPETTNTLPTNFRANQGSLPQSQLGWLRPTSATTPIEEIRRRFEKDDYVYVKNLIPRDVVLKMRAHYFSHYANTGLLKPSTSFEGVYNSADSPELHRGIGGGDPEGSDLESIILAHKTPVYLDFVANPQLRQMVRDIMSWDEEVILQRTMLRHNVPYGQSTGIHYDRLFLRGGAPSDPDDSGAYFLTAWVPIGDISATGGGLFYLHRSAELGQAIEDDFSKRAADAEFSQAEKVLAFNRHMAHNGMLSEDPNKFASENDHIARRIGETGREYKWLVADYEAGDVVFHKPCTVHASSMNQDVAGRIRLSTDLRFYDKKDVDNKRADLRWMKFWSPGDGL